MNVRKRFGTHLTICSLLCLALGVTMTHLAHAEELPYSVGLGFEFVSGTYGTTTRTDTIYIPFTVAYYPTDRINLSVEIPYVYQSNGNVISGVYSGRRWGKTMQLPAANGPGGTGGMGAGNGGMGGQATVNSQQAQNGLGDITVKGGYVLVVEKEFMPQIRPNAFVKFPTADKDRALGTGEFDEGFAVELSKWLGDWNTFAEVGYTIQGKTADLPLRNMMTYNAGVAWQVSDRFRPILFIKGATPPADNSGSLLEVRMKLKYQASAHTGIEVYAAKGVTDNSPDYGSGLAVFYDF